ncbi:MAG: actin-binding WH2 domain-containing protein [Chloroflexi bacterium]|nr:actin-binding WH2 domain-containing protein [Chloroflexota bacterium]
MQITAESIIKSSEALCDDVVNDVALKTKLARLAIIVVAGGAIYGFSMGLRHSLLQAVVSALKVPALFFITLLICLSTLHFLGLLFGSKLTLSQTLTVLLTGVAVNSVLLGSFAPISLFFLLSGSSYEFLMLLHVTIFYICGVAGLAYIRKNFHYTRRLSGARSSAGFLLPIWMLLYMFVGSQMAYILAPFVGRESVFMLFRIPQDNFYTYLWQIILDLLR